MATTTNYSWTTPDNTAYVKDGASAIRSLGSSVDSTLYTALGGAYPGLRLVKKQTIGTGVSSVAVTSAFSATYAAYKIIVVNGTTSIDNGLTLQLGPSSVGGYNTGYYQTLFYGSYTGSTVLNGSSANLASLASVAFSTAANGFNINLDVISPQLTRRTQFSGIRGGLETSDNVGYTNGMHASTNAFTDFTIAVPSGTMTGGTIYVYGYGIS